MPSNHRLIEGPRRLRGARVVGWGRVAQTTLALAAIGLLLASAAQAQPANRGASAHAAGPMPRLVGAGNLPGCLLGTLTDPHPYMQEFHATILRVVVAPGRWNGNSGEALPCIKTAQAEGYKVHLVIGWASGWPLQAIRSFFARELQLYGPYAWAVSIGNEQEIVPPNTTPAQYARVWRAIEPIVKRMTPWAIRVGGEISPWGFGDLVQELRLGLPGIQAVAVHPYKFSFGYSVAQAVRLSRQYRLPLWCDEGLREGPDSWPSIGRTIPLSGMGGVAVADVWDRL